jgi:hypothetical protein
MDLAIKLVGGALEVAAVALAVGLWRGREHLVSKLVWTVVLLVPFFGVVAYAVWHDPPPPSDLIDRPPDGGWDVPPSV